VLENNVIYGLDVNTSSLTSGIQLTRDINFIFFWKLKNFLYLCNVKKLIPKRRGDLNTSKDGGMGVLGTPETQPLRD